MTAVSFAAGVDSSDATCLMVLMNDGEVFGMSFPYHLLLGWMAAMLCVWSCLVVLMIDGGVFF